MFNRLLEKAALALLFSAALAGMARAQEPRPHFITVNSTGSVLARPDMGILVMAVQSTAPLAADAVAENTKKVKDVQSALAALGYAPGRFKISPAALSRAGNPYYAPGRPSITGIVASQFVYVFFEGAELSNPAELNGKVAAVIDALGKAGAVPSAGPFRSPSQPQGAMVVYTVKDPANDEDRALQEALADARTKAQAIAKRLRVQITGLSSINSFVQSYTGQLSGQLEGLPYRYYSMESDEIKISERVNLAYNFK